jgi:hypothetical protein
MIDQQQTCEMRTFKINLVFFVLFNRSAKVYFQPYKDWNNVPDDLGHSEPRKYGFCSGIESGIIVIRIPIKVLSLFRVFQQS